jgi:phosphohistidine phosphatase
MKRLLILRHAKSSWADSSLDDWQRPLNDRGRRDAPRVGEWLREHSLVPDLIVTSDAVRARTTAEAAARTAGYSGEIVVQPALYAASASDILGVVNELPGEASAAMIVGHNPGLESVVGALTGEYREMPTACVVVFDLDVARWSDVDAATPASLVDAFRPKAVD